METSRRSFIRTTAVAVAAAAAPLRSVFARGSRPAHVPPAAWQRPVVASTWPFGLEGNNVAMAALTEGASALDAVEKGIRVVESNADEVSVGLGGTPNADGVVQLDACIMGPLYRAGSVAALEGILHPISVARRVMEATPHVMLAGEGARQFALEQGFESGELLTEERRRAWERWRRKHEEKQDAGHDTIALLAVKADGELAGGCSTSGWGYKIPGRVGDSPILGSGLYVDGEVGAAGATGMGEVIMRHCGCFMLVESMRRGLDPQSACERTVRRIMNREPGARISPVGFVAVDRGGRCGAAGTMRGFRYNVTTTGSSRTLQALTLGESDLQPGQFELD